MQSISNEKEVIIQFNGTRMVNDFRQQSDNPSSNHSRKPSKESIDIAKSDIQVEVQQMREAPYNDAYNNHNPQHMDSTGNRFPAKEGSQNTFNPIQYNQGKSVMSNEWYQSAKTTQSNQASNGFNMPTPKASAPMANELTTPESKGPSRNR